MVSGDVNNSQPRSTYHLGKSRYSNFRFVCPGALNLNWATLECLDATGQLLVLSNAYTSFHRNSISTVRNVFLEPHLSICRYSRRLRVHSFDMTPLQPPSSIDGLQDIRLDDNAHAEQQHHSSRPACLRGPVHEVVLVVVAAFVGATFLTLQRGTIVITDSLKHSLSMDASGTSWIISSSG